MLEISGLGVAVRSRGRMLPILQDVNLTVAEDETLAIVGESGSGKSMLALAITRLLAPARSFEVTGRVAFEGRDLLSLSPREMIAVRGAGIGIMFQEALGALNPVLRVAEQIGEAYTQHHPGASAAQVRQASIALLRDVGIPAPDARIDDFPHQLSGGMRQRVMIAMVLACAPRLVIADEPTTSLDVTIQSQILSVLRDLRRSRRMSMIFISHNLGAVAAMADRVAVMYAGQVVEVGPAAQIFERPRHPYTRALLAAIPRIDRVSELSVIPGSVPRFDALPQGCRFAPRCAHRAPACSATQALPQAEPAARCCRAGEIEGTLPA
ncbi:MAG TPA: ABC transporter ATP-binding protein [Usitatibacter sp.]|nr:ABC transporter ATP-binding protein [Usitatibacter sp.]